MFFNPVILAVVTLCILCLFKVNVLLSMLLSLFVGGLAGGLGIKGTLASVFAGLGGNGETALAYILLGTFASCMAYTGITSILSKKIAGMVGTNKLVLYVILVSIATASQNIVPVHIAYIPILIPPLLVIMNRLKMDRRGAACAIAFGHKAPYIAMPIGFGLIFMKIVSENMTLNDMPVTVAEVTSVNWILAAAMMAGLLIAIFVTYRKPREYQDIALATQSKAEDLTLKPAHWCTIAAIILVVFLQIQYGSLPLAALGGLLVMFLTGAVKRKDIDDQFSEGIKLMGFIAFVMLVAGGFAQVLKDTGAVNALVDGSVKLMGGSKIVAATVITLIGLLVTMGIGTSFGTVPVLAVLYVPLCAKLGFSPAATIILISAAAALGDAGSPASDTTLGPTCGLNADGQHDHIWDTCVPTFLHFNIPLMLAAIIAAQVL